MIYRIYYEDKRKFAAVVKNREELMALRNSAENLSHLAQARQGNQREKGQLLQLAYNLGHVSGALAGCKSIGSYFFFDVDCYESGMSGNNLKEHILSKKEEIGLKMLERSASGGWHLVCERRPATTILENQVRVSTILHVEMDTSAKDLQRVVFSTSGSEDDLPYLDDCLFSEPMSAEDCEAEYERLLERQRSGAEDVPAGAKKADKHYRPWEAGAAPAAAPAAVPEPAGSGTVASATAAAEKTGEAGEGGKAGEAGEATYNGIPYRDIIGKWWELYNEGREPVKSNRDVLTFELAVNLRHICGFDRQLMDAVIPCYDGFPQEQKMKCIDSALQEKRTQMPKRLRDVLYEVRREQMDAGESGESADTAEDRFYYNRLPRLPQGIRDSIDAVGPTLSMPVVTAICPAIGMLATGVRLDVHGVKNTLNLISYIAGDPASGKGSIDPVVDAWTAEVRAQDLLYQEQEDAWRAKKRAAKNKKEQPEEPKLPVRCLTLNNTVANLAERLANTDGKHAFSFTPEADTVAQKWKSAINDFSVMLRQSYDGTRYDREARSAEAVNVHIERLLWNVTMCGTPDALYRVVSNYTDGFQSRLAVARTPDNTFARLEDKPYVLTDRQTEHIHQIAHLLPLMHGEVALQKLEQRSRQWVENVRLESMKSDDKVRARQRFRICVTAQRMTCCLMLCKVCEQLIQKHGVNGAEKLLKQQPDTWKAMLQKAQTPQLLATYDVLADYLLDTALYFFRDRLEQAFTSRDYVGNSERRRPGKNDSIFARLDVDFGFDAALQHSISVKGGDVSRNQVRQMLKNWKKQGLIIQTEAGRYRKVERL